MFKHRPTAIVVFIFAIAIFRFNFSAYSQPVPDTTQHRTLKVVELTDYRTPFQPLRALPDTLLGFIFSGKKTTVIQIQDVPLNVADKSARQVFAKVPGAFVYDMDGSGNQINMATRGLDPHRSWEYNVRQNGVITNSDMYGYPASHYSAPLESIERVDLVRGTASLQYGAQFGGMVNYMTKSGDKLRPLAYEGISTVGSFGLFSTFHSLGGTKGKWSYYGYAYRRVSKGYRKNGDSDAQAYFASVVYKPSDKFSVKAELGRSEYLYQIPGPLTDSMFYNNPRQSTRSRNYYSPDIYIPSISLTWKLNPSTVLYGTTSAVLGTRNSVQFVGFADKPDLILPATNTYAPRQVDRDRYNSYTSEWRLLTHYGLGKVKARLSGGVQAMHNNLYRRQLGVGTTSSDYDLTITAAGFGRDLHYLTRNVAVFAENQFSLTRLWSLSAGFRYEYGDTRMQGVINYLDPSQVPHQILHHFPLLGMNTQYQLSNNWRFYAGWSQAYRPIVFADIIPATPLDRTDSNLKDAYGYNAEAGISGNWQEWLHVDFTGFLIRYNNRLGTILAEDQGAPILLKTNTGASRTVGVEAYVESRIWSGTNVQLAVFSATSWMQGVYLSGKVVNNGIETNLTGNTLETVPTWISRNGVNFSFHTLFASLQYSYVSKSYSDALNTEQPSSNGARGVVPAYSLLDFNISYQIARNYTLKLSCSNLTNAQYFTKRPNGYPGAGVWSSDGRAANVTLTVKL